jgi:hypothetical protein
LAYYGGGGGGGRFSQGAEGLNNVSLGGGGYGAVGCGGPFALAGSHNSGGGGGGAPAGCQNYGAAGGSGIVVIRYQTVSIASYTWSTGANTSSISISPTLTSNYSVSVTTNAGCIGTSNTATVNVNPLPVLSISGSSAICVGQTATLIANGANTYTWSNASTASSITISPASSTSYTVAGTSTAGCASQSITTTLTVNPNPMPTILSSTNSICSGNSSTLSFIDGSGPSNAMNFDGVNDYLSIATNSNYPIGNSPYTIETWFKTTVNAGNGLIGWGNYGTVNQVNALRTAGNAIHNYWWANDLTANASPINILDGNWHHTAATYDGTTRRIYIDGILKASDVPLGHNVPN